jgi:two-component system, OmpR family, phosphate regulon response regulator PhoB
MKGKTILIVDDEPGIRGVLRIFLELEEYRILEAANAEETFAVLQTEKPDLIILDVILGGTNGFEICRQVKADPRTSGIRVCLFTALGKEQDIKMGREAGADMYLAKPLNPKEIAQKINSLFITH